MVAVAESVSTDCAAVTATGAGEELITQLANSGMDDLILDRKSLAFEWRAKRDTTRVFR